MPTACYLMQEGSPKATMEAPVPLRSSPPANPAEEPAVESRIPEGSNKKKPTKSQKKQKSKPRDDAGAAVAPLNAEEGELTCAVFIHIYLSATMEDCSAPKRGRFAEPAAGESSPPQDQVGEEAVKTTKAATAGSSKPKNSRHAISVRGHTNRGRVRQKSHKSAELVEVGSLRSLQAPMHGRNSLFMTLF